MWLCVFNSLVVLTLFLTCPVVASRLASYTRNNQVKVNPSSVGFTLSWLVNA
jgi:hypothetical protein